LRNGICAAAASCWLALGGTSCFWSGADCGCGADKDAPLAEHDLSFAGSHTLEGACACQCGDGPLETWPLDADGSCEHPDTECTDDRGQTHDLSCG
jgi:hypothetical protein